MIDSGAVKSLTGDKIFSVRKIYEDTKDIRLDFLLMMLANTLPVVRDNDHGLWRRMQVIPFNRHFTQEEADENLPDKLIREASIILNIMLAGTHDYLTNSNGYKYRKKWKRQSVTRETKLILSRLSSQMPCISKTAFSFSSRFFTISFIRTRQNKMSVSCRWRKTVYGALGVKRIQEVWKEPLKAARGTLPSRQKEHHLTIRISVRDSNHKSLNTVQIRIINTSIKTVLPSTNWHNFAAIRCIYREAINAAVHKIGELNRMQATCISFRGNRTYSGRLRANSCAGWRYDTTPP